MIRLLVWYFMIWFSFFVGWKVFNVLYALLEWLETREERKERNGNN